MMLFEPKRSKNSRKPSQDNSKKGETHLQILAELTKVRLACCHPALVGGESIPSSKLEMFRIKIREIMDGARQGSGIQPVCETSIDSKSRIRFNEHFLSIPRWLDTDKKTKINC